jgi:hypothetical protein
MATLVADITASDNLIHVTGATLTEPRLRFRIDDEMLDLYGWDKKPLSGGYRPSGLDTTRWFVARGVGGTTPSSHSAGATLLTSLSASVSGDDLDTPLPFAGASSGEQTIRLLGPFTVETSGATGTAVADFTLPAEVLLIKAFAVLTDLGDAEFAEGARVRLNLRNHASPGSSTRVADYDVYNGAAAPNDRGHFEADRVLPEYNAVSTTNINVGKSAFPIVECDLTATWLGITTGSLSFDLYALIAEPAS